MAKIVHGELVDGVAIAFGMLEGQLTHGLVFEDGKTEWFPSIRIGSFRDGIACVVEKEKHLFGYINRQGRYIFPPTFPCAESFGEGRAFACDNDGLLLLDREGRIIKHFREHLVAHRFSEGLAMVSRIQGETNGETKVDAFVNRSGETVIPVGNRNRIRIPTVQSDDDQCHEGLIRVWKGEECGYCHSEGKIVVPYQYTSGTHFSGGLAAVTRDEKTGFISRHNEVVIPFVYDDALAFKDGLAPACIDSEWGYIDTSGQWQIYPRFHEATHFVGDHARAMIDGKWGLIDHSGSFVIPPIFDEISCFDEGVSRFVLQGQEGVMERNGNSLVNMFADILRLSADLPINLN